MSDDEQRRPAAEAPQHQHGGHQEAETPEPR